jgi:hypothetical protein
VVIKNHVWSLKHIGTKPISIALEKTKPSFVVIGARIFSLALFDAASSLTIIVSKLLKVNDGQKEPADDPEVLQGLEVWRGS